MLNLSDAFPEDKRRDADISVRVWMININTGRSPKVVEACKPLDEYTWLVSKIREHEKIMPLEAAVDAALDDMPNDFLIRPYLEANRVEVKKMLLTEYNETKTMEMFRDEGREEGENKLGTLMTKLRELGRADDAFRAASDPTYREKMYAEFSMA